MTEALKLWESDLKSHTAGGNVAGLLKTASDHVTKSPFALAMDWRKIKRAPGKINFNEYLDFQIYDRARFDNETDRRRFLSDDLHWKLCYECSDRKWDATTEDKWISEVLLNQSGITTTDTLGILGGPNRSYGQTPTIKGAAQLAGMIKENGKPVFAKLNGGIGSQGATSITHLGGDTFRATGFGELNAQELFETMRLAPSAYLIQKELNHHPEMEKLFGKRIGTIRAMTFIADNKVHIPFTALKLPAPGNIADNFWRDGNMLADIDEVTGRVRRVINGTGPQTKLVDRHPETKQKVTGVILPMWDEVLKMVNDVARLYSPVKFQSVDLAITEKGPTIVEINTGGSFYLPQMASGKGLLTDEFIDLLGRAGGVLNTSKL